MAFELKATLKLVDNLSAPMKRATSAVTSFNSAIRKAATDMERFYGLQKQIASAQRGLNTSTSNFGKNMSSVSNGFRTAASQARAYGRAQQTALSGVQNLNSQQRQLNQSLAATNQQLRSYGSNKKSFGEKFLDTTLLSPAKAVGYGALSYSLYAGINTATSAAKGVGGFALDSVNKAAEYEYQGKSLEAMINAPDRVVETGKYKGQQLLTAIQDIAEKISKTTAISKTEAMELGKELYKGGLDKEKLANGGLEQAAYLTVAGDTDPQTAVQAIVAALNTFKNQNLSPKQAADGLAIHADVSAADVSDLSEGQKMFGSVAQTMQMDYDSMNTYLGMLNNAGIKGGMAGTQLKYLFDYLTVPRNGKAAGAMDELGWLDEKGKSIFIGKDGNSIKSSDEVFKILQDTYDRYKKAGQGMYMSGLFKTVMGQRAKNAGYLFGEAGIEEYKAYKEKQGNLTAKSVSDAKMDSAAGQIAIFKNALQNFQIAFAENLLPQINEGLKGATDWLYEKLPAFKQRMAQFWEGHNPFDLIMGKADGAWEDLKLQKVNGSDSISTMVGKAMTNLSTAFEDWATSDKSDQVKKAMADFSVTAIKVGLDVVKAAGKMAVDTGVDAYKKHIDNQQAKGNDAQLVGEGAVIGAIMLTLLAGIKSKIVKLFGAKAIEAAIKATGARALASGVLSSAIATIFSEISIIIATVISSAFVGFKLRDLIDKYLLPDQYDGKSIIEIGQIYADKHKDNADAFYDASHPVKSNPPTYYGNWNTTDKNNPFVDKKQVVDLSVDGLEKTIEAQTDYHISLPNVTIKTEADYNKIMAMIVSELEKVKQQGGNGDKEVKITKKDIEKATTKKKSTKKTTKKK